VDEVAAEPDLEIPDIEAVTLDLGGEETEIIPVAEELALSPEPELDEGITLDLGEDIAIETDIEPAVETAAEPEIEFELEGNDDSPIVTEEPDTSIPEIEDLGLEIEPSDDDR